MSDVLSIKEAEEPDRFWERFRSTPKKLARWLFESRERWKRKYRDLKAQMKRFQVQLSDVRKSREQWKERAQYSAKELEQMKAEVEGLRKQVEQAVEADLKKNLSTLATRNLLPPFPPRCVDLLRKRPSP